MTEKPVPAMRRFGKFAWWPIEKATTGAWQITSDSGTYTVRIALIKETRDNNTISVLIVGAYHFCWAWI